MMNVWMCQWRDCRRTVVGVGGAIGLRAIGWYFERGPLIFCPVHRPDPIAPLRPGCEHVPCSTCAGEQEAYHWQVEVMGGQPWDLTA